MDRIMEADIEVRSGSAGRWIAVLGESLTVLLAAGERSRAAELWPLVDDGATLDEVLDVLIADGLSHASDFVLVATATDTVRVLVRGAAEIAAHSREGQVRVRAADRLWQEDAFTGIVALTATLPGESSGADEEATFGLQPGLCRVGEVRWGTVPTPPRSEPAPPVGPAQSAQSAQSAVI